MGQSKGPEFWRGTEEVEEALAIARANLGTVGDANEVRVSVHAVLGIEFFSGSDNERLDDISGLIDGSKL